MIDLHCVTVHNDKHSGCPCINQYLILAQVGRGSYGTVYKVKDLRTGTLFAMKECSKAKLKAKSRYREMSKRLALNRLRKTRSNSESNPDSISLNVRNSEKSLVDHVEVLEETIENNSSISPVVDEKVDYLRSVKNESIIMSMLDHKNIIRLVEVLDDLDSNSIFFITEWCENSISVSGGSFSKFNGDDTVEPLFSEAQCRSIFAGMIMGIDYLHSHGIIHRDINPNNLLFTRSWDVKVADFGAAELVGLDNDTVQTAVGSPAFMAPELCSASGFLMDTHDCNTTDEHKSNNIMVSGKATDIWSMGATLYYILFGKIPFQADSLIELYNRIINSELIIPDSASSDLHDLLLRMLEKDPQKRLTMAQVKLHPWIKSTLHPLISPDNFPRRGSMLNSGSKHETIIHNQKIRKPEISENFEIRKTLMDITNLPRI